MQVEVPDQQEGVGAWALAELPGRLLMLQQTMSCTAEVSLLVGSLKKIAIVINENKKLVWSLWRRQQHMIL